MSDQLSTAKPLEYDALYVRQRLQPKLKDELYLHLSDLAIALQGALPPAGAKVLDYGCGGSPYRSLFRTSSYHRADFPGSSGVDFGFGEDSRLPVASHRYDCVLSTQVLEHVRQVGPYLEECRRVLRHDGCLLLSTHGTFYDHACPQDYWRWTADGLRFELERAGFCVSRLYKLTTGPRALLFLNQQFHPLLVTKPSWVGAILRLSRLVYTRVPRRHLNRLADAEYPDCRVVPAETPGHELYVGLLAYARPIA